MPADPAQHTDAGAAAFDLADLVRRALAEDVGAGDLTTQATVPPDARGVATITQKAAGVVFGYDAAEEVLRQVDPQLVVERLAPEGVWREPPAPILRITGSAAAILTAERTALNFLQRLSGIATLTNRYVQAVDGTNAKILDTRKTTPGLRALEKAAVRAGGGTSHRTGLYDMVLVKENHVAAAGGIRQAIEAVRARFPDVPLEVECQTADEVSEALDAGAPRILLDNMTPEQMGAIAEDVGGRAELEASGGIDLKTVRAAAAAGVHFVSVGALTHSAPSLDLSLILEPSP
jgi:nicotinate-nucleotide pyrophosphorylase (carboxylating)